MDVPFQSLLESAFHIPAAVENDVRMAALGEHWMGAARGIPNFVFLAIGTGIAAGIFANGTLLRGSNCTAGEVGYMYVPGASEAIAQRGTPGSLEIAIGGEGIRRHWLDGRKRRARLRATLPLQKSSISPEREMRRQPVFWSIPRNCWLMPYTTSPSC